ncbi:MAG: hypothetical protein JXP37_09845, partial [Coriobacteriia bacterium]|nr:hypothetical protein [Coriobacteriia bacterium]
TPTELIEQRTVWLVPMWLVLVLLFIVFDILVYGAYRAWRGRERKPKKAPAEVQLRGGGTARASAVEPPASADRDYDESSATRRADRRMSRKERELEAEERRQRREQRAAEAAGRGTHMPPQESNAAETE